jgi:hypothetical protein
LSFVTKSSSATWMLACPWRPIVREPGWPTRASECGRGGGRRGRDARRADALEGRDEDHAAEGRRSRASPRRCEDRSSGQAEMRLATDSCPRCSLARSR